jgi:hypothetical protein
MYRKQADRFIIRDVRKRLAEMPSPDWRMAAIASQIEHPDWFRHHEHDFINSVSSLLSAAGVDLVTSEARMRFVGNEAATDTGP